jgi:hypothetical protein
MDSQNESMFLRISYTNPASLVLKLSKGMFYIVLTIRIKTLHQKSAIIINNNNNNNNNSRKKKERPIDLIGLFFSFLWKDPTLLGGLNTNIVTPSLCKKSRAKHL